MATQEAMKLGPSLRLAPRHPRASELTVDMLGPHSKAREEAQTDACTPTPAPEHERTLFRLDPHRLAPPQEAFEAQKEDLTAQRNRTGSDRFTSKTDDVQETLKKSTYGLVQLSDFKETREKLEEQARKEAAGTAEVKCVRAGCLSLWHGD